MSTGIGRRRIIVTVVATLLISSLATHARAEGRCSNASLHGSYAFQVDGNGNGPFAAVGRNTYDGKGVIGGAIVVSLNGAIISDTYTGTYTVNDDCTGIKSATLDKAGLTVNFYFVVDSNLRELRMIVTNPGFTVSGTARKLFTDTDRERKE